MTTSIINAIKGVFTASTPWIMNKAKGNEVLIKLLQDWKIDLTKHPDEKFDVIYACTLVVYLDEKNKNQEPKYFFQDKDEIILELFRQEKIKTAFDEAFYHNNYHLLLIKINDHNAICYFNNFIQGRTRPEQFLESIRYQLINRYNLQKEDADLGKLLTQVSQKLADGERLVIVVDALDEVEQKTGGNLLYLPTTLPDKVYFLLTRRPYILSQKRLFVQGTPVKELDLTSEYTDLSQQDIKDYIRFSLENDACEYKDDLNRWIQNRKENITTDAFVEQVAEKSENNFMYLRFVLPDIANGNYDDVEVSYPVMLHTHLTRFN